MSTIVRGWFGRIPPEDWGKDHASLLAYVETVVVDRNGKLAAERLGCNPDRHPHYWGSRRAMRMPMKLNPEHGLRVKPSTPEKYGVADTDGTITLGDHDDFDGLDDLEAAGLLIWTTGALTAMLTDAGCAVAGKLRTHKAKGGNFAGFKWPHEMIPNKSAEDIELGK